VDRKV